MKRFELDEYAVQYKIVQLLKQEKVPTENFDEDEWTFVIRRELLDDTGKKIGRQSYKNISCPNYKIWEVIKLEDIKKDTITLVLTCILTTKSVRC